MDIWQQIEGVFVNITEFLRSSGNSAESETYAFQAGYRASEQLDDFNPYKPGTESYRHWAAGHLRQQRDAATYW